MRTEKADRIRRADLFTTDETFYNILLREHPNLRARKVEIDDSDPQEKIYYFLELDYSELRRILPRYLCKYEFEVRNSETGDFLWISRTAGYS